jgi:HD superfamily phosphohydrolase YqeK
MADATSANAAVVPPPNRPSRPLSEALLNEKVGATLANRCWNVCNEVILTAVP